jgi:hypothetical protein
MARPVSVPASGVPGWLLLVTALDTGLLQELAVLLLRHPLATLLDNRTHETPSLELYGKAATLRAHLERGRLGDRPGLEGYRADRTIP